MPACLPVELEEGDTKCQMPPKLQSGYNGYVVHTHGQRPTANVADQKKNKKKKQQGKFRAGNSCSVIPWKPAPNYVLRRHIIENSLHRTVDVMTEY